MPPFNLILKDFFLNYVVGRNGGIFINLQNYCSYLMLKKGGFGAILWGIFCRNCKNRKVSGYIIFRPDIIGK